MKKFKLLLVALFVAFVGVVNVNAATKEPEYTTLGGKKVLIANGTAITISAPTTEGMGATVTWEGGSIEIAADTSIFGGYHNDTENVVDTNITMNGGTVRNIHGGGLHKSTVGTATITINAGTVTGSLSGGGYEEFLDCGEGDYNAVTEEDVLTSTTKVETANIEINGGDLYVVFGGGGAHAYTGTANIVVNDTDATIDYLVAGGSNGHTQEAYVTINGGTVNEAQSVNRGSMDSAVITVDGGTVTTLYAGGADNDKEVTGTIASTEVVVQSGTVSELKVGTNGGQATPATDVASVAYLQGTVTTIDETTFAADAVVEYVELTFVAEGEEETGYIPVGTTYTAEEVEELKALLIEELEGTGYTFEDFYADEELTTKFDMTQPFNADTKVYLKLVQLREEESEDVVNPDTSDIGLVGIIATILLAGAGLGYTIKKRKFN